ncbi:hypothetical protein ALC62_05800 [Cyphomyrmex costatus]|uniref:Uncharacterized protein n=1 Tax=Cyphomyrmex costatus TaxID=456900 RepID=A0A195CRP1_9HYME|nr:hypothetical protein ALC62_05800 [Cyphomyrmex costatus]
MFISLEPKSTSIISALDPKFNTSLSLVILSISTSIISIFDLKSETSLCPIIILFAILSTTDLRPSSDEGPGWDFAIGSSSAPTSSKIRATPVTLAMICFA